MCGIFGIIKNNNEIIKKEKYTDALCTLSKRGPDDSGFLELENALLGHSRLSIIDIEGGSQPMIDKENENVIVFNGEIYNYKKLKKDLEEKGHYFNTNSDTEVILKLYAEYGHNLVQRLDGMFAFAIWNKNEKELFIARDRFGEKPLFFSKQEGKLFFASEIKALLATKEVKPIIDKTSIDNYLALLYVPPWRSIYKTIKPLPPASYATYRDNEVKITKYWKLKKKINNDDIDTVRKKIKKLVSRSVNSRLVSDVEIGSFLSGGIDSGIVTSLAAKALHSKIKTFSVGFGDSINELPFAKEVAKKYNTDHHEKTVSVNFFEEFKDVTKYFDQPFADSSNVPTSIISKYARKKVKVSLSGDGGDELFFGYGHYCSYFHQRKIYRLINIFDNQFDWYKKYIQHFNKRERSRLWKERLPFDDIFSNIDLSEAIDPIDKINLFDFYTALPGDMLTKLDASSMLNSLEIRSPFLQHELAEYAFNIPHKYKSNKNKGKLILKDVFKEILPDGFFDRKKQGFGAPVEKWLKYKEIKDYIYSNLYEKGPLHNIFHSKNIKKRIDSFYKGSAKKREAYKIWILLSLDMWFRTRKEYIIE